MEGPKFEVNTKFENETRGTECVEDEDVVESNMCAILADNNSSNLATDESLRLELIRQLDCGAISPFDIDDVMLANEDEDINQHLTEDIGLTSVQSALQMQRQMVDLQTKQTDVIVSVLEQQKETNKYLNEIVQEKVGSNAVLERHFEEQKNINNRLEELLTLFRTQVEIKVK